MNKKNIILISKKKYLLGMSKTILAISVIAFVAIVMVMGAVAPAMASHDKGQEKSNDPLTAICHKGEIIYVKPAAVAKHLAHGDTILCPP